MNSSRMGPPRAPWVTAAFAVALAFAVASSPGLINAQVTPAAPGSAPTPSDAGPDEEDGVSYGEEVDEDDEEEACGQGGRKNVVQVRNRTNGRLRVRGNIQLNRIRGSRVEPVNLALAYNEACVDCRSIAVALQVNLITRSAATIVPENRAYGVNVGSPEQPCTRCVAVARAIQYVYSVDDPSEVPDEARELITEMDRELRAIHADRTITLQEAQLRVNAVIARFRTLPQLLLDEQDEQETADDGEPAAAPTAVGTR